MKECWKFALLLLIFASACSRMDGSSQWIRQAHDANLQADDALRRGEEDKARDVLVASLEKKVPDTVNSQDSRIVQQDMCFRLALVEMDAHRPKEALSWAKRGLALGERQDLFTANLYVAQGRALESMGDERSAAKAYHQALKINEALLNPTLEPERKGP